MFYKCKGRNTIQVVLELCSLISGCTLFLWVTKIIHKWEIWKTRILMCRTCLVATITRQRFTLIQKMKIAQRLHTNTTLIEISSRYSRVQFTTDVLERNYVVTTLTDLSAAFDIIDQGILPDDVLLCSLMGRSRHFLKIL